VKWTVISYLVALSLEMVDDLRLEFQSGMITTDMYPHVAILPKTFK
jgi:hypothetical protein